MGAMKTDRDYRNFILVTNYQGSGEDVMVFTCKVTSEQLERALQNKGQNFDEIYDVPAHDLQYYIYEPLYAEADFEESVIKSSSLQGV
jgi:hypothetical protein